MKGRPLPAARALGLLIIVGLAGCALIIFANEVNQPWFAWADLSIGEAIFTMAHATAAACGVGAVAALVVRRGAAIVAVAATLAAALTAASVVILSLETTWSTGFEWPWPYHHAWVISYTIALIAAAMLSVIPRRSPPVRHTHAEATTAEQSFFVVVDATDHGPYPVATLVEYAATGQITPASILRRANGSTLTATELPGLF